MRAINFQTATGSPDSPEWHAWRAAGIGGSDAPVIGADGGLCSRPSWAKSTFALWQEKTGAIQPLDLSRNPAILRGKNGEESARLMYERLTNIPVMPMFGEMDGFQFVHSSFDGMSSDGNLIVEIKCPSATVHGMAADGQVVDYYLPQLCHQAMTAWGHPEKWLHQEVHFASFVPETGDLQVVPLLAVQLRAMTEKLLDLEIAFWDSVTSGVPPCGNAWLAAAAVYKGAYAKAEAAEMEVVAAKATLISILGDGISLEGGGVAIRRSEVKGRVDYGDCLTALGVSKDVDVRESWLDGFRGPSTETITVRLTGKSRKGGAPCS